MQTHGRENTELGSTAQDMSVKVHGFPAEHPELSCDSQTLKKSRLNSWRRLFESRNPCSQFCDQWGLTGMTQVGSGGLPGLGYFMTVSSLLVNPLRDNTNILWFLFPPNHRSYSDSPQTASPSAKKSFSILHSSG